MPSYMRRNNPNSADHATGLGDWLLAIGFSVHWFTVGRQPWTANRDPWTPNRLSGLGHNYDDVRCAAFGPWL